MNKLFSPTRIGRGTRPGEWFLFGKEIDDNPLKLPSWLIQQTPEDKLRDLAHELAKLYGLGRARGQREGRKGFIDELKELMEC